ncbi:MAG: septum formation initiator family protein [Actinomycetota bacterium]
MAISTRRLRVRRLRLGLLALVVGALAVTGIAPAQQMYDQRKLIEQEEAKLTALTEKNAALENRLSRSQDPAYMEKLAREQLGLVRPGETSYVVIPGPALPAPPAPPAQPSGWWDRVSSWFREVLKG